MNCTDLIDIYEKTGGILICDYTNNLVHVEKTRIRCNIQSNSDYASMEKLLFDYGCSPIKVTHLKSNNNSSNPISNFKKKNHFLNDGEIGFKIEDIY
jgi:hypothetical protein